MLTSHHFLLYFFSPYTAAAFSPDQCHHLRSPATGQPNVPAATGVAEAQEIKGLFEEGEQGCSQDNSGLLSLQTQLSIGDILVVAVVVT